MTIVLSITGLFFVISGAQYWCSHYMINVLNMSEDQTYSFFIGVCLTGPTFGAWLSGYITARLGGYESKNVLYVAVIACIISSVSGILCPIIMNYKISISFFWVILATGAFVLPILAGVMLNDINPHLKEQANSLANFSYNLFGYLPAPTLYGFVNTFDTQYEKRSNYGMCLILWMTVPVTLCVIMVTIIRYRRFAKKDSQKSPSRDLEN